MQMAMLSSGKPMFFARFRVLSSSELDSFRLRSISTRFLILLRKKASHLVMLDSSSMAMPLLMASAMAKSLMSVGLRSSVSSSSSVQGSGSRSILSISRERMAFIMPSSMVRPMAITSPVDFIWVPSTLSHGSELVEGPARYLDDDVVQGRLEGGEGLAGYPVGYLVQGLADGDLGRHPGNGVTGGLGS